MRKDFQDAFEGNASQNNDHLRFQQFQLALEEGLTIIKLLTRGLVGGRRTAAGSGDIHIMQFQAIVPIR